MPQLLADAAAALAVDRSDAAMRAVVDAATRVSPDPSGVAVLAEVLAASGERLPPDDHAVDVASTGAPGSLTTLLTSPLLVASGRAVPKIAVPGRPAGGIDALGSLPHFRVDLARAEFLAVLAVAGHAHVRAGSVWVPADAELFEFRQKVGAQAVPALAAASLLAKKIAAGVMRVVLDVRVAAHGNFGRTVEDARAAARLFVDAAGIAGITATAVLSDASGPQQPWIGRGEALSALQDVVDGTAEGSLRVHAADCAALAATAAGRDHGTAPGKVAVLDALAQHLEAQGVSEREWRARADAVAAADRFEITVPADGYLKIDLAVVRDELVAEQKVARPALGAAFPDPSGLILLAMPGDLVTAGRSVAAVRRDRGDARELAGRVAAAFAVAAVAPGESGWQGETIN